MSIRGLMRRATVLGHATPTNVPIYIDADDNIAKMIPAGSGTTQVQIVDASSVQTLTNKTLTSPTLTTPTITSPVVSGLAATMLTEVVTTTNVIAAAESGTSFILNSATPFVSTLPAPAAGLWFRFTIGQTVPSGGNHTVVTNASANIIDGGAMVAGAEVSASDEDSINFIDACLPGDFVEVWSDGTNWYVNGRATTAAKLTFTAA